MIAREPGHAVWFGRVRHRRFDAVRHAFSLRLFLVGLDLDDLDRAFAGRWFVGRHRLAPWRFRRADFFGPPDVPLADAVRDAVGAATGVRPAGRVLLLTNLRTWGYVQNPVSFYFCHDAAGRPVAVLAEITNTPWGERHHHVVAADARGALRARFAKRFHVSPFQPMGQEYVWAFSAPGERLAVHMQNRVGGRVVFDATLSLRRRPWSTPNLLLAALLHPWITAKVVLGIYWHALRLWCKRAPFFAHPKHRSAA